MTPIDDAADVEVGRPTPNEADPREAPCGARSAA